MQQLLQINLQISVLVKHTFKKEERLSSQKTIGLLFDKGSSFSFSSYPFRLVWINVPLSPTPFPAQVVITVSKKRFKHAVDRNRIKRLVREAYRTQKAEFLYPALLAANTHIALMIIYTGNTIFTAQEINLKLNNCLLRLVKTYGESASAAGTVADKNI